MFICDQCLKDNKMERNNSGLEINLNRQDIGMNNENISSQRRMSHNKKLNILNNQNSPIRNSQNSQANSQKNISILTDEKKKVCCDCCVIC